MKIQPQIQKLLELHKFALCAECTLHKLLKFYLNIPSCLTLVLFFVLDSSVPVQCLNQQTGENLFMVTSKWLFQSLSALYFPNSNADEEHAFSNMNLVKSKLRCICNKNKISTWKAILTVKYGLKRHESCCVRYGLETDALMKDWYNGFIQEHFASRKYCTDFLQQHR